ncbi:MAG: hypothetical protein MJ149_01340 [Clostridia bacterium]|nr:hypothetical protein [Clostridia bacterium]
MKIKICGDVYNISKRLKFIDKYYYVVYDTRSHKFEIHNSNQLGNSYCLALPYNQLDERTLNFVRETSSKNIEEILNKMDNLNKLKENADMRATLKNFNEVLEDNLKE